MRYLSEYELLRIIQRLQRDSANKIKNGSTNHYERYSIYALNDFKKEVKIFLDTKYGK